MTINKNAYRLNIYLVIFFCGWLQDQLFWVWLRIYKMRNYVVENLIEVQRLRQEIKLREVLSLQMPLLNEWSKLDAKNSEALSKLTRKLHALSVRLPLLHGATVR